MTTAAPTPPGPFIGQLIGQAERATRAVLDTLLDHLGLRFEEWVGLRQLTMLGGATSRTELASALHTGSRLDPDRADAAIDAILDRGWVTGTDDGTLTSTAAGRAQHDDIAARITATSQRLYGHLAADELAVLRRALTDITVRAEVEAGLRPAS